MQEEDFRYFLSELKESLPFRRKPRTKTVEYLRIGKSPLVAEVKPLGKRWHWAIYCDGWSEPTSHGITDSQDEAQVASIIAMYQSRLEASKRLRANPRQPPKDPKAATSTPQASNKAEPHG